MNQVVSKKQFQEFMNELREDNKRRATLIAENGRMIDKQAKDIHKMLESINRALVPVFSIYKNGKIIKMGGVR